MWLKYGEEGVVAEMHVTHTIARSWKEWMRYGTYHVAKLESTRLALADSKQRKCVSRSKDSPNALYCSRLELHFEPSVSYIQLRCNKRICEQLLGFPSLSLAPWQK